jgi:hypothetical protein
VDIIKLNFSITPIPNIGAWVLENSFSIETGRRDLICNLNSLYIR